MKINDVHSSLIASYNDWKSVLINPRYIRQGNTITWDNYLPKSFSDPMFLANVVDLIDEGQYTFQVITDGGILQLYYAYDSKDKLIGANLAYISANGENDLPVGWIRIDYDPINARGLSHPNCHMHWSLFPNCRFSVNGIPSPRQFIEFIICSFYPDLYQAKHFDESGNYIDEKRIQTLNSICFPWREEPYHRYMSHFVVPSIPVVHQLEAKVVPKNPHKGK